MRKSVGIPYHTKYSRGVDCETYVKIRHHIFTQNIGLGQRELKCFNCLAFSRRYELKQNQVSQGHLHLIKISRLSKENLMPKKANEKMRKTQIFHQRAKKDGK